MTFILFWEYFSLKVPAVWINRMKINIATAETFLYVGTIGNLGPYATQYF